MSNQNHASDAPVPSPAAATAQQQFDFPPVAQSMNSDQGVAEAQARAQQEAVRQASLAAQQRAPGVGDVSQYHNAMDSSSPFRNDFSLVAEAVKRAQMSVLMRDLGDVAI